MVRACKLREYTRLAISMTCAGLELIRHSPRPGTMCISCSNISFSFLSLCLRGKRQLEVSETRIKAIMNLKVSVSSAGSNLARCTRALLINTCGLHMVCTVLPKCHPWYINGLLLQLHHNGGQLKLCRGLQTRDIFLVRVLRALT